jgi:hypothetical protein
MEGRQLSIRDIEIELQTETLAIGGYVNGN